MASSHGVYTLKTIYLLPFCVLHRKWGGNFLPVEVFVLLSEFGWLCSFRVIFTNN